MFVVFKRNIYSRRQHGQFPIFNQVFIKAYTFRQIRIKANIALNVNVVATEEMIIKFVTYSFAAHNAVPYISHMNSVLIVSSE
ncbi:hypothetical protein AWY79_09045 [Pseudodesulfovibrio indicus]|uniref:Uncharacterized protein n=1 Tax=Pseudodesulfovibrio indicus TaxID=1716143 RepID=A0ABN4LXQ2_9BACT|nr:hypothetical protein AWY79_09045 [Pseudodesulfovibrio indicus]